MVALSTEIFAPMRKLGCATACSGVALPMAARLQSRKGPPDAVMISLATRWIRVGSSTWKMAECSESTGMITPPAALAASSKAGPAQTRLSLLARPITAPVFTAARVGARPAEPMIADITQSHPKPAASITAASPAAQATPLPFRRWRSSPSSRSSAITAIFGRHSSACSASKATLAPAVSAIT